jgi:hypothetical protein
MVMLVLESGRGNGAGKEGAKAGREGRSRDSMEEELQQGHCGFVVGCLEGSR